MSKVTSRNVLLKQPAESRTYSILLKPALDFEGGELLTGTPTVTASPTGLTISEIAATDDGCSVAMRIADGNDGERYRIECVCNTTSSNRVEADVLLDVKDE